MPKVKRGFRLLGGSSVYQTTFDVEHSDFIFFNLPLVIELKLNPVLEGVGVDIGYVNGFVHPISIHGKTSYS